MAANGGHHRGHNKQSSGSNGWRSAKQATRLGGKHSVWRHRRISGGAA